MKSRLGMKDKLGIAKSPGFKAKPGVKVRPGEVERASTKPAPSYAEPSLQAVPVVRPRSPANGKAPAIGKAPVVGKPAVNGRSPVKGKVVLEGKALLPQKPPLEAKPVLRIKPPAPKVFYDCSRCPGYCCSYPRIEVKPSDVRRLAAYHGITVEQAERKFTRIYMDDGKPERILRHQKDTVYDTICRFFDTDLRRCTIYEGRPQVCREYPNGRHCGYYTFIKFERKHQDDDTFIPSA